MVYRAPPSRRLHPPTHPLQAPPAPTPPTLSRPHLLPPTHPLQAPPAPTPPTCSQAPSGAHLLTIPGTQAASPTAPACPRPLHPTTACLLRSPLQVPPAPFLLHQTALCSSRQAHPPSHLNNRRQTLTPTPSSSCHLPPSCPWEHVQAAISPDHIPSCPPTPPRPDLKVTRLPHSTG